MKRIFGFAVAIAGMAAGIVLGAPAALAQSCSTFNGSQCMQSCNQSSNASAQKSCVQLCQVRMGLCLAENLDREAKANEARNAQRRAEREQRRAAELQAQQSYQPQPVQPQTFAPSVPIQDVPPSPPSPPPKSYDGKSIYILGDVRMLSVNTQRWLNDEPVDEFTLTLSGIAFFLADRNAAEGAGVVAAGSRSGKMQAAFVDHIQKLVFATVRPPQLKSELLREFPNAKADGYARLDPAGIEAAVLRVSNREAESKLLENLRWVQKIAYATDLSDDANPLWKVKTEAELKLAAEKAGTKKFERKETPGFAASPPQN